MSIKDYLKTYLPPFLAVIYAIWGAYLYYDAYIIVGEKYWLYSMFDHDELWIKAIIGFTLFFWCVYSQLKNIMSRAVFSTLIAAYTVSSWRNSVGDVIIEALDTQESRNIAVYNHPIGYEYLILYIFWLLVVAVSIFLILQLMSKYLFKKPETLSVQSTERASRFPSLRGNLVKVSLTFPIFLIIYTAVSLIIGDISTIKVLATIETLAYPLVLLVFLARPSILWEQKAIAFLVGTTFGWMAYGMYMQSMVVCGYGCSSPDRTVAADSVGAFIFGLIFIGSYSLVFILLTFFVRRSNQKNGIEEPVEYPTATTTVLEKLKSIPFSGALFTIVVIILIVLSPVHPEKQRISKSSGIYIACVGADKAKLLESERTLPTKVESCTPEKYTVAGKEVLAVSIGYMANCGDNDCLYSKEFVIVDAKMLPIANKPQNPLSHSKNGVDPIRDRFGCDNLKIADGRYWGLSYTSASLVLDSNTYRWMLEYDNVSTVDKWGNTCSVSGYQIDNGGDVFDYSLTVTHSRILSPSECPQPKYALASQAPHYEASNDPSYTEKHYAEYEMCLRSIAHASGNSDLCTGILNKSIKSGCYEDVARSTLNESLCSSISKDYQYSNQEYCRSSIKTLKEHERIPIAPSQK